MPPSEVKPKIDPRRAAYLKRLGLPPEHEEWHRSQHSTACVDGTGCDLTKAYHMARLGPEGVAVNTPAGARGYDLRPGGARGVRPSSRTRSGAPPPLFRDSTGKLRHLRADERLKVVRLRIKGEKEWMTPAEYAKFDFKAWRRIRNLIRSGALEAPPLEDVPVVRTSVYDDRAKARPAGEPVRVPVVSTVDDHPLRVSTELLSGQVVNR